MRPTPTQTGPTLPLPVAVVASNNPEEERGFMFFLFPWKFSHTTMTITVKQTISTIVINISWLPFSDEEEEEEDGWRRKSSNPILHTLTSPTEPANKLAKPPLEEPRIAATGTKRFNTVCTVWPIGLRP